MDIFTPIQLFADFVTYTLFRLVAHTYLADAVNFFVYDGIKIGVLLIIINYIMAITRYYFPIERVKEVLTKRRWFGLDYLLAALLGMVTPFCSCSSIPLFIGFLSAGIPLGVTFTFLISSPLINETSLYLFPVVFGWKITFLYNAVGILISILGGMFIQRLNMEQYVKSEFLQFKSKQDSKNGYDSVRISTRILIRQWTREVVDITKKIFPYVVLGVGIGAVIHGFIPENLVAAYLSKRTWYVVPLAVLMGVPLYANSVSIVPVIEALVEKGIPLGTALAFMTATVALSLPEALILKRVMKWQLLGVFLGVTIVGIVIIGYLFNMIA